MYFAIMFSLTVLFAVMSALLLTGRGAFLIAGYNTASPGQKAVYDEKKLCRVNGAGLAVITVLLAVMTAMGTNVPGWFPAVFLTVTLADGIAMVVLSRTVCRAEGVEIPEPTEEEKRKSRIAKRIGTVVGIAAAILVTVILFTGDIEAEFGVDAVVLHADFWADHTIRYEDVEGIELRQDADVGVRVGGLGSFRLLAGNFQSETLGSYIRYAYTGTEQAVFLTVNGRTVVLSGEDNDATMRLYEELCRRTGLS